MAARVTRARTCGARPGWGRAPGNVGGEGESRAACVAMGRRARVYKPHTRFEG